MNEVSCVSKVFDNADFGYRRCTVERPLRLLFQIDAQRKSRLLDAAPVTVLAGPPDAPPVRG